MRYIKPYINQSRYLVRRVRQCLDSWLPERKWWEPRKYKILHSSELKKGTNGAVAYCLTIEFDQDPKWTRLWEKVTHDKRRGCLLPLDPGDLKFNALGAERRGSVLP